MKKVPLNIWIFIIIYLRIYFISSQYKKRINGDVVKKTGISLKEQNFHTLICRTGRN